MQIDALFIFAPWAPVSALMTILNERDDDLPTVRRCPFERHDIRPCFAANAVADVNVLRLVVSGLSVGTCKWPFLDPGCLWSPHG